ncbi:MAG: DUF805 domain-containing protein [Clostridiales bacterium]|jgi:uncharacterized membrane protein YhaH (DUF805 family)|nr:DUF805 domain-containing protein [Clostridiales bacterium]
MNVVKTYFNVFKKDFANFKGTETAETYVIFAVGSLIISVGLLILALIFYSVEPVITGALFCVLGIFGLAVLIPALAIITRRLRGKGKTAVWLLLLLIPTIDVIFLVWLAFDKNGG